MEIVLENSPDHLSIGGWQAFCPSKTDREYEMLQTSRDWNEKYMIVIMPPTPFRLCLRHSSDSKRNDRLSSL